MADSYIVAIPSVNENITEYEASKANARTSIKTPSEIAYIRKHLEKEKGSAFQCHVSAKEHSCGYFKGNNHYSSEAEKENKDNARGSLSENYDNSTQSVIKNDQDLKTKNKVTIIECKDDKLLKENVPDVKFIAPDGGWGWVVLGASICITMMTTSANMCFSIEFGPLMKEMQMSSTAIAWVFNVNTFVWHIVTPMVGPLCKLMGYRTVALTCTFVSSVCYIILAFATSPAFLFVFYGIIFGVFAGMSHTVIILILAAYFDKRRGFAICLNLSAVPAGYAIIPQALIALQTQYGFQGATLIHGGLFLNACVAAALYHPVERHQQRVKYTIHENCFEEISQKLIKKGDHKSCCTEEVLPQKIAIQNLENAHIQEDFVSISTLSFDDNHAKIEDRKKIISIQKMEKSDIRGECKEVLTEVIKHWKKCLKFLKSYRVLINGCAFGFFMSGYINFGMLVPFAMVTEGHSYKDAAKVLSCAATANFVARLAMSFVSDWEWFNNKIAYMSGSVIASVSCASFVLSLSDLRWLLICSIGWGAGTGLTVSLWMVLLIETMGIQDYVSAMGTCGMIVAVSYITIGPLLGLLRDVSSSYAWSLSACAILQLVAAALWTLMPLAVTRDAKKQEHKVVKNDGGHC